MLRSYMALCVQDAVFRVLLFVFVFSSSTILTWGVDEQTSSFNVMNYGAKSDCHTDASKAFVDAWNAACKAPVASPTVYVPAKKIFLVNPPVIFQGPCKASTINFMIAGTVIAPLSPRLWDGKDAGEWLVFKDIHGLHIQGSGIIDGRGKAWWDQSCRYHNKLKNCTKRAPTALQLMGCNESSVSNIKFINSAQTHMLVQYCDTFNIDNVTIESPGNTPNTDGIHIHKSQHVIITNSTIACGDDCISIGDYISDMNITNIQCGPGHGISIGSLGKSGNAVQVENIHVNNATFIETTNGARIKTYPRGTGYVRNITFENLHFNNVENPIIIDQTYCEVRGECPELKTAVKISNVVYREANGTSASDIAVNLNCSTSVPCEGILMDSIHLTASSPRKKVTAYCRNARGREENGVVPGPCLH